MQAFEGGWTHPVPIPLDSMRFGSLPFEKTRQSATAMTGKKRSLVLSSMALAGVAMGACTPEQEIQAAALQNSMQAFFSQASEGIPAPCMSDQADLDLITLLCRSDCASWFEAAKGVPSCGNSELELFQQTIPTNLTKCESSPQSTPSATPSMATVAPIPAPGTDETATKLRLRSLMDAMMVVSLNNAV